MMIEPLIYLAFRIALRFPRGFGLYPIGFYVRQALLALKMDDLDTAVSCYRTARSKDFGNEKVLILREILSSEIEFRRRKLLERLSSGDSEDNRQAASRGIVILDRLLGLLGEAVERPAVRD